VYLISLVSVRSSFNYYTSRPYARFTKRIDRIDGQVIEASGPSDHRQANLAFASQSQPSEARETEPFGKAREIGVLLRQGSMLPLMQCDRSMRSHGFDSSKR
jgi:hypothetical protein